MRTRSDEFDLAAELLALRPSPRAEFTAELDANLAAGFAKGKGGGDCARRFGLAQALRGISPRRLALPAAATTVAALVIATALIAVGQEGSSSSPRRIAAGANEPSRGTHDFSLLPKEASPAAAPPASESTSGGARTGSSAGFELSVAPPTAQNASASLHRHVERGAELVLRTAPSEIDASAQEVFAAVHAAHGIVLSSSIRGGSGRAHGSTADPHASFQLLIPSAHLSDTLASLSRIADVSARHESTLDITAPTISAGEQLDDAQARIDSLLAQLAGAESEAERATVEAELRSARRQATALRSNLDRLHQRAHFAQVSLRIESDHAIGSSSGPWGIDDAFGDAGHILSTAAAVAVIGIALIAPLAAIGLLAWLAHRAWVRRRRESALGRSAVEVWSATRVKPLPRAG